MLFRATLCMGVWGTAAVGGSDRRCGDTMLEGPGLRLKPQPLWGCISPCMATCSPPLREAHLWAPMEDRRGRSLSESLRRRQVKAAPASLPPVCLFAPGSFFLPLGKQRLSLATLQPCVCITPNDLVPGSSPSPIQQER